MASAAAALNIEGDRALLSHVEANLSTEPDLMFTTWRTLEWARLRLVAGANAGEYIEFEGHPISSWRS